MTREYTAFVASSNAAERAGDAETALEYHQGVPMFARSAHRSVLQQLAGLSEEMTPWLWARWAAYQCTRAEDPGTESSDLTHAALEYAVDMFHPDLLPQAYDAGDDPIPLIAQVMGQNWAFHQICTFELGGLKQFLDAMVTGRLADGSELAREWVGARMGGYRIESTTRPGLVVRDLALGRTLELLDLGARVHAGPGGWLIGRVVPSGTTPALMFDTRPLPVDEQTATECVTDRSRGAWIVALAQAIAEGRVDRSVLLSEDRELVTDVPSLALVARGTPPSALAATFEQLARGRDEVGRAAYRILRAAAEGSSGDDEAPYVAAAVVNVHGYAEARRCLVHRDHRAAWMRWATLVPEPARGRLALLAELSGADTA